MMKHVHTLLPTPTTRSTTTSLFLQKKRHLAPVYIGLFATINIANLSLNTAAHAQTAPPEPTLSPIVITAPAPRQQLNVGGFGDAPLRETPISATVIDSAQIKSSGAQKLSDVYKFDASVSDAYNAVGYIDYATVRGFVIDNKFNIRRDGLPISGDTAIGLANKDRVEILKGTSGIQAGTSAPGGLVNYVIKRPPSLASQPIRSLDVSADSNGQLGAALDLGGRFGEGSAQGYRLSVAADRLQSAAPGTRGSRQQLALALDSRIGRSGWLEAEFEYSRQSQPNVPGLSILGNTGVLPLANPQLNLNRQAWSQPTEFEGLTGSLRYSQAINDHWQWSAHLGSQHLKTNDRIAFPFGCTDSNGIDYFADRFCPNGDVDIYDFRSEGERRKKNAAQFKLDGRLQTGSLQHAVSLGLLQSSGRIQAPDSAYNYSGTLNLAQPTLPTPADPSLTQAGNTQREKTTEFFATDMIAWSAHLKTWLGLRHTRLHRNDAQSATRYRQSFSTPWLAASYQFQGHTLYASHGHGIESRVTPNLPAYGAQAGLPLAAQRSRQTEIGIKSLWKGASGPTETALTLFDIRRPLADDSGSSLVFDGQQRHTGLEVSASHAQGAWQLGASATLIRARRENSAINASLNSLKPTNVPSHILRFNAAYRIAPSWQLGAHVSHEGRRAILPDNSRFLSAWTRVDASLAWEQRAFGQPSTLRVSINNLLGKRYFQESPHQFGHAYLFPAAPRSLRVSLSTAL
jgi:iron complex outermembrane recepter protein